MLSRRLLKNSPPQRFTEIPQMHNSN
jgi:hypothetical protein